MADPDAERQAKIRRLRAMNDTAGRHLADLRAKRPAVVASGNLRRLAQLDQSIGEYQAEIHARNGRLRKLEAQ